MEPDPNSSGTGANASGTAKSNTITKKKVKNEDMSDEDLALKQQLELYVERIQDSDPELQKVALQSMRLEIITSTSSMTSVPMPIKFLRPHYATLKAFYETMAESVSKKYLADILSVLALTMSAEGERESLKYRLFGTEGDIGSWGHEYVRNLAGEIAQEYVQRQSYEAPMDELIELVRQIVAFHMNYNSEPEAVDLLMEVEDLDMLNEYVNKTNFKRTCLYLTSSARYLPEPNDMKVMDLAYSIYLKFEEYPNALRIALFMDKLQYARKVFTSCNDVHQKKQFCYIIARHGIAFMLETEMAGNEVDRKMLQDILYNSKLSEGYLALARDLEVMEAKSPREIYKPHLLDGHANTSAEVDLASQNLAATFVTAFVNAGFRQAKLMTITSDAPGSSFEDWLFVHEEHGRISAVACLGMISLWDVDSGQTQLDQCFDRKDVYAFAGALLGVGIVNCNIKNDCDPAITRLVDYTVKEEHSLTRIGAIMGLGIAYAGSKNEQLRHLLTNILIDDEKSISVTAFTAISLGLIYVGSCNEKVAETLISVLMARIEAELEQPLTRLLPLGLGLLYLGKKESMEATAKLSKNLDVKMRKYWDTTLLSCAYAGTGNVLKIQKLLGQCSQHLEEDEVDPGPPAVLGIAMVAMAEEIGLEMAIRSLEHLLQYREQNIRQAVPLALALLCISNPKVNVMDTLSRLSHDTDLEVAMAAVISLGLIGAGTNNARIAGILRNLSQHYCNNTNLLFCVRIAQGLVHMGKGLLTLNPYHSDRFLLSPTALAGLVIMLYACLDVKTALLRKYHYVLYFLVLAMQPRMLLTVDENLNLLSVPVRVGQAVGVEQAGRPKIITGFRTQSTPILLAVGDMAELATEKYIPLSPILEGVVILKNNPDFVEELRP
ncbi:26S proteasome non-ATPase regulatory subunit 2 homolog A-like [Vicia villosa]|uniref:26S proteasome non-ATPase regulatory subunit 2 homolog A-like n=1 Tax=Vicia villosa TaxID=3911 RepID=UPI00273C48B1|nr:26S proteasome non-ATPase regulatory subunit 2 homolog A-like [Vicia villosa]